jgi:HSP20 family protein
MANQPSSAAGTARAEARPASETQLTRRSPLSIAPLRMLDRFADEMDRMFDEFGLGRTWTRGGSALNLMRWTPQVDVEQRGNELIIRADLPGMSKDDVKVDVTDDAITIQGERRREQEEQREGVYRSERSHGQFYRMIALPEGAKPEEAKATFKDGVLEITMPAQSEQSTRGRRLEISEGASRTK